MDPSQTSHLNGSASNTAPRFTLDEVELDDPTTAPHEVEARQGLASGTGPRSDAAVFNLDLEYSDDDALLDWEQYAGLRRWRCCGLECNAPTWARPHPPDWWWSYTKRQRRFLLTAACCAATFLLLVVVLVAAAASGHSVLPGLLGGEAEEACAWVGARLPTGIVPLRYDLTLAVPMTEPYAVNGTLNIGLNVTSASKCVVLHAATGLGIRGAWLGNDTSGPRAILRDRPGHQQLVLQFPSKLQPGEGHMLHFEFGYNLSQGLSGFYRSVYTMGGAEHSLATTQFEATSARSAFPCFDEPALKAVFALTIKAPDGYTVLSNMPVAAVHHHAEHVEHGEHDDDDDEHDDHDDHEEHEEHEEHAEHVALASWHFHPTPPMSTYLLAIVVGNLAGTSRIVPGAAGIEDRNVTVWGTPGRQQNLDFAADIAAKVLAAYESALGVPYTLPKLDLVAIPDFSAGAMENWGLILYREVALLTSPTSSLGDKRYVAKVVAHEMAHMWFGDLVTMEWWGELWLNEGFASYLEFYGAQAAAPELDIFLTFYSDVVPGALEADSLNNSHPMSLLQGVESPDKIESMFDSIEYEKAGAVLRMLRAWVNRAKGLHTVESNADVTPADDLWLTGLQSYLTHDALSSTTGEELWSDLAGPLNMPGLVQNMRAWTYQQGYPLLQVSLDDTGHVWLQQSHFGLEEIKPCDASSAFWIPIALATADTPAGAPQWTELSACQSGGPVLQNAASSATWIKANAGQYGFFRVQYDQALWARLLAAGPALPAVDLAGLLEDSWALASAGQLGIDMFLDLVKSLETRPPGDYEPWAVALPYLRRAAQLAPCSTLWQNYVAQTLLSGFLARGGPNNASSLVFSFDVQLPKEAGVGQHLLRPAILAAAGYYGNQAVTAQALTAMADTTSVAGMDADVRGAVLETAVHAGPREVWAAVQEMYLEAGDADERERTLRALATSPAVAAETLDWALGDQVRAQDLSMVISTVAARSRPDGPTLVWNWLKQHWTDVYNKLGGGNEGARRMGTIMEVVASLFSNQTAVPDVEAVFAQHKDHVSETVYLDRARDAIQTNAAWVAANGAQLCTWTAQHAKLKP